MSKPPNKRQPMFAIVAWADQGSNRVSKSKRPDWEPLVTLHAAEDRIGIAHAAGLADGYEQGAQDMRVRCAQAAAPTFDRWWYASKYCQVVIPREEWRQIALDGFAAGHDQGARSMRELAARVCESDTEPSHVLAQAIRALDPAPEPEPRR